VKYLLGTQTVTIINEENVTGLQRRFTAVGARPRNCLSLAIRAHNLNYEEFERLLKTFYLTKLDCVTG